MRVRRKWVEAGVTKERSEQEEREKQKKTNLQVKSTWPIWIQRCTSVKRVRGTVGRQENKRNSSSSSSSKQPTNQATKQADRQASNQPTNQPGISVLFGVPGCTCVQGMRSVSSSFDV